MSKARRKGPTLIQRSRMRSPAEKALFHHVAGAGKSRVKRPFFDLDAEDVTACRDLLARRFDDNLRRQG